MASSTMALRNMLGLASCLVLILISQTSGAKIKLCYYVDDTCSETRDFCSELTDESTGLQAEVCSGDKIEIKDILETDDNNIGSGLTNSEMENLEGALISLKDGCMVVENSLVSCVDFKKVLDTVDFISGLEEINLNECVVENEDETSFKATCEETKSGKKLTDAEITGIVLGSMAGAFFVFGGTYYCVKKNKLMSRQETPEASMSLL